MKIAHIVNSLDYGGAERLLLDMLPRMRNAGAEVSLFALNAGDSPFLNELKARDIDVEVSPAPAIYSMRQTALIRSFLRRRRPDVAHVHLFPAALWSALAAWNMAGVRLVTTEHNTRNRRRRFWLRPLDALLYRRYLQIVCVSASVEKSLVDWMPAAKRKTRVIENGIDFERFAGPPKSQLESALRIVSVGRLTEQKGFDVLLRAIREVPNATLQIVGDGPLRQPLEELASSLDILDRVEFLGARSDVPQLLASAAVYVQSSAWEGFGLATAEAMCAGLPIVVSDVPGVREVVGDAGLRFAPGSHSDLAEKIETLHKQPELRNQLRVRARSRAKDFSITRTVTGYLQLYSDLSAA